MEKNKECYLEFLTKPNVNGYKFCCRSEENRSDYSITGVDNNPCPRVKLRNFDPKSISSETFILIQVSLVTEDCKSFHPFPLKSSSEKLLPPARMDLLSEESCVKSSNSYRHLYMVNRNTLEAEVEKLSITSVPESNVLRILELVSRKQPKLGNSIDPKVELKKFGNLNRCRLQFQAVVFSVKTKSVSRQIGEPLFSDVIENCKIDSLSTSTMKIPLQVLDISRHFAKYNSNEEIYLAASYIENNDLEIEFFQFDQDEERIIWLKRAQFFHTDIFNHRGINFLPPTYDLVANDDVLPLVTRVYFRLYRPSTNEYSERNEFFYVKDDSDLLNSYSTEFLRKIAAYKKRNLVGKAQGSKEWKPRMDIFKEKAASNGTEMVKPSLSENVTTAASKTVNATANCGKNSVKAEAIDDIEEDSPNFNGDFASLSNDFPVKIEKEEMEVESTKLSEACKDRDSDDAENEGKDETSDDDDKSAEENGKSNTSGLDEVDHNKPKQKPMDIVDAKFYRKKLDECEKKMNSLADRTSNAILDLSETRSILKLIGTQRYLLSVQNSDGDTPIHLAIKYSHFDMLEVFTDVVGTIPDCDIINMKNNENLTPLLLAAYQKEAEVCDFLLESKAKISYADTKGMNCVHIACKNGDFKVLEVVLKHLKETGIREKVINKFDSHGFLPLHHAIRSNSLKCVELLVNFRSLRINEKALNDGMTVLHYAALLGNMKIASELLKYPEINIDTKRFDGCTPLHLAVMNRNYFTARKLIICGANMFVETNACCNVKCNLCKSDNKNSANNKIDLSVARDLRKDFPLIVQNSKTHFDAIHYANNNDIMQFLLQKGNQMPREMVNRILRSEMSRAMDRVPPNNRTSKDITLEKNLKDPNFDVLAYVQEEAKKSLTVIDPSAETKDSLAAIYDHMTTLNINENVLPEIVLNMKNEINQINS